MYFSVALNLPKESDLLLDPPPTPDCDKWGRTKSNYLVPYMHSDPLWELIRKEVSRSFRSTYAVWFEYTAMRKYKISLKLGLIY